MSSSSPTGSNPVSTLTQDDYKLIQKHSEVRQKIGKLEEKEKKVSTIWFTLFHKDDLVNLKTEDSRIETTLKYLHLDQETIQNIQTIYDLDQKIQKTVNSKWYQWFEFGKKDIEKHISSLEKIAHTANEHEFQALTFATSKLDPQKTGLSDNFSLSKLIRITETFEKLKPGTISAEFSNLARHPGVVIIEELNGQKIAISEPYTSKTGKHLTTLHDLAQEAECLTLMKGCLNVSSASYIEFQDGRMFATMENMEGEELRTKLAATDPPLTPSQKISILSDIAKGLQELHNKGFVLGNLTSANILIDKNNKAVISNLSCARPLREGEVPQEDIAAFEALMKFVLYSKLYVSPEDISEEILTLILECTAKKDNKPPILTEILLKLDAIKTKIKNLTEFTTITHNMTILHHLYKELQKDKPRQSASLFIDNSSGEILEIIDEKTPLNSTKIIISISSQPDTPLTISTEVSALSEFARELLNNSLQTFNTNLLALQKEQKATNSLSTAKWTTMITFTSRLPNKIKKPSAFSLQLRISLLNSEIQQRKDFQAQLKTVLSQVSDIPDGREITSDLKKIRKFDRENTKALKELEADLKETTTLSPPPDNPWTKETVRTILRGSAGVNDDIENFDSTPMRSSLIKDASRSLNIYHQKEGEAKTPISIVDNLSTEDSDIERGEKTNIKSLYDKIGETRMRKIDLLLSHGSDAIKFKDLPYESIASTYPELDMLPTRFSGEGQRFTKITETATHIIIEQEILLKLSDNPRDDDSFKSCYLNTISRTSIPIAELDSEDFLTRTGDKSGIKASMTFFRPCLTKEAAIACCPTEQSLRHPLKT